MSALERVTIVGAGLMGHGMAQVFAAHGHPVMLTDNDATILAQARGRIRGNLEQLAAHSLFDAASIDATVERVTVTPDLAQACANCNVVFEAVFEDMALKQSIFAEMDRLCPPEVILCSNTSVMSITEIASKATRRERILGTHWWNPPYLVPLVEVVRTADTAEQYIEAICDLLTRVGKRPVRVHKDVPGFVGNRLQHALWREAFYLIDQGICDAETVDEVVRNSFGMRLPVLGPVENADMIGLDLVESIHAYIEPYLCNSTTPSETLRARVAEKRLGFKSGAGFLTWSEQEMAASRKRLAEHLMRMLGQRPQEE
ncbi:MAG TPA: 3-hydroxyacyl-CoA dehydrogenase NAD-binding domain-containing protein [Ktedonobacteraceae bacterium]|jgi:3-hydroxybutyryl-CoA dehydrogenase|nr:3-hydroxyacyl-CoA dehydrogenase NAD-binding domain-containing protein [Ktedonobacteraceae bacterium]